jgi:hypothetical protein
MRRVLPLIALIAACSAKSSRDPSPGGLAGNGEDSGLNTPPNGFDAGGSDAPAIIPGSDPRTCDEAALLHSYVGCDYWPTVVANNVWSVFDYAVVVANAGTEEASVTVTGPMGTKREAKIAPGALEKIYLPWVPELKGPDLFECAPMPLPASVRVNQGAFHLVSTRPVTVWQFNALEYRGTGGPVGKKWDNCPPPGYCRAGGLECFSFTNDASLLLPSTAMTGNYRVTAIGGWTDDTGAAVTNAYFAITATKDNTDVTVAVGKKGRVLPGGGVVATEANGTISLKMNAGDVVELACEAGAKCDPSGSLVRANKPVQVISGVPCTQVPNSLPTCDHIEEVVLPAETFGKHYVVTVPTGPHGSIVGHVVRIYGNVDGTKLTYSPRPKVFGSFPPPPDTINAGDVAEIAVNQDFDISGDQPFGVSSFMIGSSNLDPMTLPPEQKGDPSQTSIVPVEQYRKNYVFLAPDDYDFAFVDVVSKSTTTITLDGTEIGGGFEKIAGDLGVRRIRLGKGKDGAHTLLASDPVGVQVIGYGSYTSYMIPGGMNLTAIAPPPVK